MGTVLRLISGASGAQLLKWDLGDILGIHMEMYGSSVLHSFLYFTEIFPSNLDQSLCYFHNANSYFVPIHGLQVPAMFKIANTKHIPEIPESFSKEGKDFVSLCLKRDPTQRPSASQLLCHPFLQDHQALTETKLPFHPLFHDHQALRETKCNTTRLRNGLSLPAGACHKKVTYLLVLFYYFNS